jgi:putative flippase GtrA
MSRGLAKKLVIFGAVGGAASLLHIAVAYIGLRAGMGVFAANTGGFAVAFVWSYLGHYHWTFQSRGGHGAAFLPFAGVALAGFGINSAIVALWRHITGAESIWAIVLAVGIAAGLVFFASNFWAFARGGRMRPPPPRA